MAPPPPLMAAMAPPPTDSRPQARCLCGTVFIKTPANDTDWCHTCHDAISTHGVDMSSAADFAQAFPPNDVHTMSAPQTQTQIQPQTQNPVMTGAAKANFVQSSPPFAVHAMVAPPAQTHIQNQNPSVRGAARANFAQFSSPHALHAMHAPPAQTQPPFPPGAEQANWVQMNEEMQTLRREQQAELQRQQLLRQREAELQRRIQTMMMHSSQRVAAPNSHITQSLLPPNMRIANTGNLVTNQPAIRSGIDMNHRAVPASYNMMARTMTPVHPVKRTHEGFIVSPMKRTDSFSPLHQHGTPPIGQHYGPPTQPHQQQQQRFPSPAVSKRSPQVMVPANTMLQPAAAIDGAILAQTHNTLGGKMTRCASHARHGSSGSSGGWSGAGYTSSNGSANQTPNSTPPSGAGTWTTASPVNKSSPAQGSSKHRDAQIAAINAQIAHEQAAQHQKELGPGAAVKVPQKLAAGRLLCRDCNLDKPIVRNKNDGVYCTTCFTKRNKAGGNLQTLAQLKDAQLLPHVHKAAPAAKMSPSLTTAMHHLQRSSPVLSGQPSASKVPPYELDFARRRAAVASPGVSPQLPGSSARRAATQQPSVMRRASQTSFYTPSPLAHGQQQVPQTITSPSPSVYHSSPNVGGSGTPKRSHAEAFTAAGLGVLGADVPTPQLSPPQSNKRSKPSPRQELPLVPAVESRPSTLLTPDKTPSRANHVLHGVNLVDSTYQIATSQPQGALDWLPESVKNDMAPLSPGWVQNQLAALEQNTTLPGQNYMAPPSPTWVDNELIVMPSPTMNQNTTLPGQSDLATMSPASAERELARMYPDSVVQNTPPTIQNAPVDNLQTSTDGEVGDLTDEQFEANLSIALQEGIAELDARSLAGTRLA